MCGIAGVVDPFYSNDEINKLATQMTGRLQHRGPDHQQVWSENGIALGHTRLKIIDLSDGANQPFEAEQCLIVFNGEIYNYVELKAELEDDGFCFKTGSDSEVILAAYIMWGETCTKRFAGMWAFAIWDKIKKQLFCSRDRFGIKPFYFIKYGPRFHFASEYKALKLSPLFSHSLNMNQVKRGLLLGWTNYNDESYYSCINTLLPAHNLVIKDGELKITRYWNLSDKAETDCITSVHDDAIQFYELFKQALKQHSRSDVKLGACLSGGLDSSSITSLYSLMNPGSKLETFTIFYSGSGNVDEREFVIEVKKKYSQGIHPHFLMPDERKMAEEYHHIADFAEVPLAGSSYISQYFVMKLAANHGMKVMLDGQGADEYLGGYMHGFYRWMASFINKLDFITAWKFFNQHRAKHNLSQSHFASALSKSIFLSFNNEESAFRMSMKQHLSLFRESPRVEKMIHLPNVSSCKRKNFIYHMLFTTSLPTLLHYEDRTSMAFSIESRVPFLDHRLVEYCYNLPAERLVNHEADTKVILRRALHRILPRKIQCRKDKKAFTTPGETQWLRNSLRHLLDIDFHLLEWLDAPSVNRLIAHYIKGDNKHAALVWRLAALNYWVKNIA